jgi:hypothetical protein
MLICNLQPFSCHLAEGIVHQEEGEIARVIADIKELFKTMEFTGGSTGFIPHMLYNLEEAMAQYILSRSGCPLSSQNA